MCKFERKTSKRGSLNIRKAPKYLIVKMRVKNSKNTTGTQKKLTNMEHTSECPLCLEPLEMDDANFFPCKCGYQICRFCWHRIRTNENGLCPQCRKLYTEDPANFKPLTAEELQKLKTQKKAKESQKKQKILEGRKQLSNVRILQKNLVFVVGLPQGLDSDAERKQKIFQPFEGVGPILKSSLNDKTSYAGAQGPSACAYIVYQKCEDAVRAIKQYSNLKIEGRSLKVSLGTTKYCCNFLKNLPCHNKDCMYLHELASDDACFTKEEIHAGKHLEYEAKLMKKILSNASNPKTNSSQSESKKIENQDRGSCSSSSETFEVNDCSNECRLSAPTSSRKSTEKSKSPKTSPSTRIEDNLLAARTTNGSIETTLSKSLLNSPNSPSQDLKSYENSEEQELYQNPIASRTVFSFSNQLPSSPVQSKSISSSPSNSLNLSPHSNSPFILSPQPIPWQSPVSSTRHSKGAPSRSLPELASLSSNEVAQKIALDPTAKEESLLKDELGFDPCEVALKGLSELVTKNVPPSDKKKITQFLLSTILPSNEAQLRSRNGIHRETRKKEYFPGFIPQMNGFSPVYSAQRTTTPVCDMNNHTFPSAVPPPPAFQNHPSGTFSVPRLPVRNNAPFLQSTHWQRPTIPTQPMSEFLPPQNPGYSQPPFMPFEQRNSTHASPAELQTRMRLQRLQDLFIRPSQSLPSKPNFSLF